MQRKHFITAIVIACLLSCFSWGYSGGSGTPADPYQIAAVADWQQLMNTADDWDKHFILTADLDLQGVPLTPVGSSRWDSRFTGLFDGNGHIIRNAVIDLPGSDYVGLFGYLGAGGHVRDLGAEDVNITGDDDVGGLVGDNHGTLTSCYATGQVSGDKEVGGLVGQNYGTLTSCYATGQVTGDDWRVGGLVGENYGGTLTACYATGQVTGDDYVGGLVGRNRGTLTSCYATGQVTGNSGVGGLVGWNADTVSNSYATGSATGGRVVGGLVGQNTKPYSFEGGTISNCYAAGKVAGDGALGGLVGVNTAEWEECECSTEVSTGTITRSFWDKDATGESKMCSDAAVVGCDDTRGKTTSEMKTIDTFINSGWDFVGESKNGTDDFWKMIRAGEDYPRLSWQVEYPADIAGLYGVDLVDFVVFSLAWLSDNAPTSNWNPTCDISEPPDGIIDELDLAVFCENWLAGR